MGGMMLIERARAAGLSVSADGDRLVVKGPKQAAAIAKALLAAKAKVMAALRAGDPTPLGGADGDSESCWPEEAARWPAHAREIFLERLAIGDDLGMDTAAGSPAWEVAVREARRAAAGIPPSIASPRSGDLIDTAIDAFASLGGLRFVGVEPKPPPERDPFVVPGLTRSAQITHIAHNPERPGPPSACFCCGHRKWWSIGGMEQRGWCCGCCHPPHCGHMNVVWWGELKSGQPKQESGTESPCLMRPIRGN